MEKKFIYNFILFTVILLICVGSLCFILISGNGKITRTDNLVIRANQVIVENERLAGLTEAMLANQHAYILTGEEEFLNNYTAKKNKFSDHLARLSELSTGNEERLSRLDELRNYFNQFSMKLEERALGVDPYQKEMKESQIDDMGDIISLKENIIEINTVVLKNAYSDLNKIIYSVESKKNQYFNFLLICIATGTMLLLIFNAFLLKAHSKRSKVQLSLTDTEKRYELVISSTQDGVFDWDISENNVFYSPQFFNMMGRAYDASVGDVKDFSQYVHPDDEQKVWDVVVKNLKDKDSDYTEDFRLKHKSGKWIWVRARAKAFYNKKGNLVRMVGIHTDITDQVKESRKLKNEKQDAEEASKAKGQFLAHMSHEIRTPLTAISGIAEILQKEHDKLSDKQNKLIKTLVTSSQSLKNIVNDVLDFSKIESSELELDEAPFYLENLFQEIISMMSLRATEKGIKFNFDYTKVKKIEFYGDKMRMRQILVNLIANAIKFTEKGQVAVKAYLEGKDGDDFLRIDVKDTGVGIEEEEFDMIFERFKQADSSSSRKYGGTGLGLPISKNLSILMGGDITLESCVGKGSIFSFAMPARIVEGRSAKNGNDNDVSHFDGAIKKISKGKKILLVEDYDPNVVFLSHMLDDLKLDFDVARTGKQAVDLYNETGYDCILMDIQMPEMDGLMATALIRKKEKTQNKKHTPIIGMTAHALVEDRDKCITSGMDSYLPKPIIEYDFKKEIFKALSQADKKVV